MGLRENLRELKMARQLLSAAGAGPTFGQEVRLSRQKRGMTLESLSAATGMAKSYLSQIETGYAPPPRDDKVARIAEALGLDAAALLARAHLSQLPEHVKAQMARMEEVFDSAEEVMRALLAAKAEVPAGGAAEGQDAGRADPSDAPGDADAAADAVGAGATAAEAAGLPAGQKFHPAGLDLDALHRSGLLHHLAEWGEARVEARRARLRAVPIINKVAAGYPQEFTDLGYPVGIADEYVSVPAELADPNAFAVRVVGDSMEPRYHEGDVVIFTPAASVRSGDDCFIRFAVTGGPADGESTFKRVFFDSEERVRLQPLNEQYAPTFVKPADIAGIFRAAARYERL